MLKKKFQNNFTTIDNRIAQMQDLSFEARGLYFYMFSLPENWEFSEERLANNAGIGITKIKRILKELMDKGLLSREFFYNDKGYKKSIYTLYDFDTFKNTTNENPTLENPTCDFTTLENPMNNKIINIKNNKFNKIINLNKKEKNIKKEKSLKEQALDLFYEFKNEINHFSLDDWSEWVEYKFKKDKKMTIATFLKNIKQLISFGVNAKLSIERSISSNWSGLFEIKNNNYKKSNERDYSKMFQDNRKDDFWENL